MNRSARASLASRADQARREPGSADREAPAAGLEPAPADPWSTSACAARPAPPCDLDCRPAAARAPPTRRSPAHAGRPGAATTEDAKGLFHHRHRTDRFEGPADATGQPGHSTRSAPGHPCLWRESNGRMARRDNMPQPPPKMIKGRDLPGTDLMASRIQLSCVLRPVPPGVVIGRSVPRRPGLGGCGPLPGLGVAGNSSVTCPCVPH
ncbi:hypothetical protein H4W32_004114 [Actinophytocola algeriensis]|uniref:Uncharacterized protein n=1 Tax=Actinophytocola algeriensis TaxID=1768010 RepID=A0A7W7QAK2_9PSEU|nr:hypothetical protein [Actinophytocola algeriensis]MBE1476072.1 hypothetical protein [Actinophytocola algeriensis]